eukprot:7386375-Prymnesium_polylepis.2
MSGFCHHDGPGVDERVQFGQREAPVLTGRQSCFIVWAVRRELWRLDAEYPTADPAVTAWLRRREGLGEADGARNWWQRDVLSFVLMFVNDVGGVSLAARRQLGMDGGARGERGGDDAGVAAL